MNNEGQVNAQLFVLLTRHLGRQSQRCGEGFLLWRGEL
jgi:hypothetical protein